MTYSIRIILLSALTAIVACSSTPQVAELSNTADPNQEIARVESQIKAASERQVNILSPRNFESASDSLDKAKEARNKNKDQKDILHLIAVAEAYLNKANAVVNVSNQLIPGVIKERQDALTALAPKYFPDKFSNADRDLNSLSKDIENNDTSGAEKNRTELEARYSDLELQSIRKAKIGGARNAVEQANKEGAKKLVPQTLAWAEKQINQDDAVVTANRHNAIMVDKASADAIAASSRLLTMVRQAKSSSQQTPEQLAGQVEQEKNALGAAETNLGNKTAELAAQKTDTAVLAASNVKLEEKDQLELQYEFARKQFSGDEAEVYKQGDKLLLRLKGLSFPKDQSVITTNNYPLLTKVQTIIREVAPQAIVIEGHTDSTGAKAQNEKLSASRAEAVEGYLKANSLAENIKISATGYGDSKPIASNKTKVGRAQNRRVDVILESATR